MMQVQTALTAAPAVRRPAGESKPNFSLVNATNLRTIVQRGSPMFKEGAWPSPEARLLGAVVEQWLFDLVQEARRQFSDEGHLFVSPQVRTLCGSERVSVEAIASAIGIEPVWFDRILAALDLFFLPVTEATRQ